MMFLRERRGCVERVRVDDKYTAREKAHALFVLGGAVVVAGHPHDADPASGAGNCWCGRDQSHTIHRIIPDVPIEG